MLSRLILAGGQGGVQAVPLWPPTDDSWVRDAGNPWYDGVEPTVMYDRGLFRMWARGDYAECADGINFPAATAQWGGGAGGYAGTTYTGWVTKIDGVYYRYYTTGGWGVALGQATSTDGYSWVETAGVSATKPAGATEWGNRCVWKEGSTWWAYFEANGGGGGTWAIYLYSSSDGKAWTIQNGGAAVSGLSPGGAASGLKFAHVDGKLRPKRNGVYDAWFHGAVSGNLPTDIYHATSTDKVTWTRDPSGPVLTHLGGASFEFDQVADPCVVVVGGQAYLYYDGVDNTGPIVAKLAVALAPAVAA